MRYYFLIALLLVFGCGGLVSTPPPKLKKILPVLKPGEGYFHGIVVKARWIRTGEDGAILLRTDTGTKIAVKVRGSTYTTLEYTGTDLTDLVGKQVDVIVDSHNVATWIRER